MMRFRSLLLTCTALALLAGLSLVDGHLRADDARTTRGKYELLQGTVESVSDNQVTIRTSEGKDRKMAVDDGSRLRLDGRAARLADFKKGTRVRVRYQAGDGKDRIVMMRTPLAAKILAAEGRDFLNSLKDYGFDKKAQYESKLRENVAELDERIEDLQDRVQAASGDAKARAETDLRDLQRQRDQLRGKMERLKVVGADAWDSLKADIDRTTADMHRTYDRAREAVK